MYKLSYAEYLDKVYGGWYGKCLGGAAGAPVEGIKKIIDANDFTDIMNAELPNDDLDIQLLWLEVLEQRGVNLTSIDLAEAWMEKCWYPFSEYGYFMKNYKRGISPPYSGSFNNSFFKESMGCPIRSEIWGFTHPGDPVRAAKLAEQDGTLDHANNSVWAEMFLASMESMVFFESDIHRLLDIGLKQVPATCKLALCVKDMIVEHARNPHDWLSARNRLLQVYGHPDFTGVLQNLGIIVIALLYGEKDMRNTINIALRCGYDADCTCASAAAIVGGILGYSKLSPDLQDLIHDRFVVGIDIQRRSNSIKHLAEDTCVVGVSLSLEESSKVVITDVPVEVILHSWVRDEQKPVTLSVDYVSEPSIGAEDCAEISIRIENHEETPFIGELCLENLPDNWHAQIEKMQLYIRGKDTITLSNKLFTSRGIKLINNSNKLSASLYRLHGELVQKYSFGIAGAAVWKVCGPYFEALEKQDHPDHPSPHGEGCVLPSLECMVNNAVYLEKPYLNEQAWLAGALTGEVFECINAYEDRICFDFYRLEGQCCFYLEQEIYSPDDREVWLVVGNNDGFKLWLNETVIIERDEMRYWTPYNNAEMVKLKEGVNRLSIKLLRRSINLEFAIGFRYCEGEHWHKKEWITDMGVVVHE